MTQVCNFADDTTFYVCDKDLNTLTNRLEHDSALPVEWSDNHFMKLNQDKCHLLTSGHKHKTVWAKIGETKIWESNIYIIYVFIIPVQLVSSRYCLHHVQLFDLRMPAINKKKISK